MLYCGRDFHKHGVVPVGWQYETHAQDKLVGAKTLPGSTIIDLQIAVAGIIHFLLAVQCERITFLSVSRIEGNRSSQALVCQSSSVSFGGIQGGRDTWIRSAKALTKGS